MHNQAGFFNQRDSPLLRRSLSPAGLLGLRREELQGPQPDTGRSARQKEASSTVLVDRGERQKEKRKSQKRKNGQ